MEHEIPFGNSNRENGTTFLDFPLFLGIFQWDEPTKRVPFTAEPEIAEILGKWKAPRIYPTRDAPFLGSGRRSLTPSQKWRQNDRSYVRTEVLTSMIFVRAQKQSRIV